MPWTEHDYLEAVGAVGKEDDPATQKTLQKLIRQYENARGPGQLGQATGIEAFEEHTGMSQPSKAFEEQTPLKQRNKEDRKQQPRLPVAFDDETKKKFTRGGSTEGSFWTSRLWHEPSLEQFQRDAETAFDVDEVAKVTEKHPAYRLYADVKWAEASDAAQKAGKKLVRVRDLPANTTWEKAQKYAAEAEGPAAATVLGVQEAGLPLKAFADDEQLAEARELSPTGRTIGNVIGMVSPYGIVSGAGKAASKLIAPAAGKAVLAGSGGRLARMAGRAIPAAVGGAAELSTLGAAREVTQGVNPFSLDFLGRRAKDAGIGAVASIGSEALGTGVARLGRSAKVGKLKEVLRENALAKRLDPIASAMGGAQMGGLYGYVDAEKDDKLIGTLAGLALGGVGVGGASSLARYALLNRLARGGVEASAGPISWMASKLQAAPLDPKIIEAITNRELTKGAEVFGGHAEIPAEGWRARSPAQPPQTGTGVGAPAASLFGIPFTTRPDAAPSTLSKQAAEAFIRDLMEEERAAQRQSADAPYTGDTKADESALVNEGEESEPIEDSGETASIGLLPSNGAPGYPPRAAAPRYGLAPLPPSYPPEQGVPSPPGYGTGRGVDTKAPDAFRHDPEFMALLDKLGKTMLAEKASPEDIADTQSGYIRNYAAWRSSQDAQEAANSGGNIVREPETIINPAGRFKTGGPAPNEPRGTEIIDDSRRERTGALTAKTRPLIEAELKERYPKGATPEQVADVVTRRLMRGSQTPSPHPDLVKQSMKNLGYAMPRRRHAERGRARRETSL